MLRVFQIDSLILFVNFSSCCFYCCYCCLPALIKSNRNRIGIASKLCLKCSICYCCCCCKLWLFRKGKTFSYSNCCEAKHTRRVAGESGKWQAVTPPHTPHPPPTTLLRQKHLQLQPGYLEISIFTCAQRTRHAANVLRRLQSSRGVPGPAAAAAASPSDQGHRSCGSTCPTLRHKQLFVSCSPWQHCVLATFCSQTSVDSTMCACVCVCVYRIVLFAGTLGLCGMCGSAGCHTLCSRDHLLNGRRSVGLQTLGRIRNYKIHATEKTATLWLPQRCLSGSPRLSLSKQRRH